MSDNKKWVKAWTSLLTDPDFQNMRIEDKGRWFTIMLLLGQQGTHGMLRIYPPSPMVCLLLGVPSFEAIKSLVTYLEKCNIRIALHEDGSIILSMQNWRKYQIDDSKERVQKHRALRGGFVTAKKRREETLTSTSTSRATRSPSAGAAGGATREDPERQERPWQKKYEPIPDTERMSPEEMRAIRIKNMSPNGGTDTDLPKPNGQP